MPCQRQHCTRHKRRGRGGGCGLSAWWPSPGSSKVLLICLIQGLLTLAWHKQGHLEFENSIEDTQRWAEGLILSCPERGCMISWGQVALPSLPFSFVVVVQTIPMQSFVAEAGAVYPLRKLMEVEVNAREQAVDKRLPQRWGSYRCPRVGRWQPMWSGNETISQPPMTEPGQQWVMGGGRKMSSFASLKRMKPGRTRR